MEPELAISARNLSKVYRIWNNPESRLMHPFWSMLGLKDRAQALCRDFPALSDISLDVPKGTGFGIIGLNGSGKSTLLQLVAGTLRATTGSLTVNGRVAAMLELGSGFNPEFTGRENVYLNATVLGLTRAEIDARFDAIAAFADIGDFIEHPVKTYSSGMYVRLGFAVLSQVDPEILIIDEALSVGDFLFQQKCFDVMRGFRERGVTFIIVSHSMSMVLELCDRAIVLEAGRLVFEGNTPEAVAVYQETAVRARYGGQAAAPAASAALARANRHGGATDTLPPAYELASNVDQAALLAEPGSIHSPKAGLLFARFLDSSYRERLYFQTGEDMVISIGFRVNQALAEPHVGFKIRDQLGRVIFETSSLCMRQNPGPVYEGEVIVGNFRFRIPLCEGEYSLVVGFAEGSVGDRHYREALFFVQQVKTFSVVLNTKDILWTGITHIYPKFGWSILNEDAAK